MSQQYGPGDPRNDSQYEERFHDLYRKLLHLEAGDRSAMTRDEIEEFTRIELQIHEAHAKRRAEDKKPEVLAAIEKQRLALLARLG